LCIGFFLDFIEITFIHVPVLAPIMIEFGYDPLWFCILIAVNLQTSFHDAALRFSLFYLKAVTPPEIRPDTYTAASSRLSYSSSSAC
jgi:TRAP-type mannitol/chloroaromatic compound transport system permease large subunit